MKKQPEIKVYVMNEPSEQAIKNTAKIVKQITTKEDLNKYKK